MSRKVVYYVIEELTGEPFAIFNSREKARDYVEEYNSRSMFTGSSLDEDVKKVPYNPTLKDKSIFEGEF